MIGSFRLAWVIYEKSKASENDDDDAQQAYDAQARMLARAYVFLFLRDYLPRGLTGRYGHICGGDVMDHLLCHITEQYPSRHKATKDANTWLQEIENPQPNGSPNIQKAFRKIPGLLSPAGVLILLIMDYPDHKYMDRIGRLGLMWMMDDRNTLHVRDGGFWAGIQAKDIDMVFAPPERREAEVDFLADYDKMFGNRFVAARMDMRPYLLEWTQKTNILETSDEVNVSDLPVVPSTSDTRLRDQLWSPAEVGLPELKDWLRDELISDGGGDDVQISWFTS
ncbi:hypothetical protein F4782DRAFT_534530 [Xylaria castorea]|nr:hypothetical protein F4782DRAFT_534530 [Xylaria castorea]